MSLRRRMRRSETKRSSECPLAKIRKQHETAMCSIVECSLRLLRRSEMFLQTSVLSQQLSSTYDQRIDTRMLLWELECDCPLFRDLVEFGSGGAFRCICCLLFLQDEADEEASLEVGNAADGTLER